MVLEAPLLWRQHYINQMHTCAFWGIFAIFVWGIWTFFLLFLYFKLKQNDSFCKSDHKNTVDRIAKHTHTLILLSKISTLNQTTANKKKKRSNQSNIWLLFHQKINFLSLIAMKNPRHILSKMIRFLICHDIYIMYIFDRRIILHTHLISTATHPTYKKKRVALSLIYPSLSLSLTPNSHLVFLYKKET